MNSPSRLEQAKNADIVEYLSSVGVHPQRSTSSRAYYCSPLRSESKPSFMVDKTNNRWADWGLSNSYGDIIDLVSKMEQCSASDAIDIILKEDEPRIQHRKPDIDYIASPAIEVVEILDKVMNEGLIAYMVEERGIECNLVDLYCKEVHFRFEHTKYTTHFGIGFHNDKGGWEIRNRQFKVSTSPKTVTTIPGENNKVLLFEGFVDFLSFLTLKGIERSPSTVIVLNSLSFVPFIAEYLLNYDEVNGCLDNDTAGDVQTDYLLSLDMNFVDRRYVYNGFNDFNLYLKSLAE